MEFIFFIQDSGGGGGGGVISAGLIIECIFGLQVDQGLYWDKGC